MVEWVDSVIGFQGWKIIDEQVCKPTVFISVGFVTHETKETITIFSSVEKENIDNRSGSGDILIPKCSILKMTSLNKKK